MRIRAGKLRHRVTVQTPTSTRTDFGSEVQGWTNLATVYARVFERKAAEVSDSGKQAAQRAIDVEIRHLDGLDETCRISWGDRVFNIAGIANSEEPGKGHIVTCVEVDPEPAS